AVTDRSSFETWSIADAVETYGIRTWGHGYFDISSEGDVTISLANGEGRTAVSLHRIYHDIKARGLRPPVLLRFSSLLDAAITDLNESFQKAISDAGYRGRYRGVYPIKVNQQQQVIEEVSHFGTKYHYGLEAGSKAELIAALAYMHDPEAYIVCNGYKDEEFTDLALLGVKLGLQVIIVIERPGEVHQIIERSRVLGVSPRIGVRVKLASKAEGMWTDSGGDRSIFGLTTTQILETVDVLKREGMLGCLELMHYHLGSQIPNIRNIRSAMQEACRFYVELCKEGAPMGILDVGGGLAVDYDGSQTNFPSSRNYTLQEFCDDVVDIVMSSMDAAEVPHPVIVTESGRATVAYYSVLLFNILDVSRMDCHEELPELPAGSHEALGRLAETYGAVSKKNIQEVFHDALYYRDEARELFLHGELTLRERGLADRIFWSIIARIRKEARGLKHVPEELEGIDAALTSVYYGNFSVFQSLPDLWAIEQLFPIMPIHRLKERPRNQAIISDTTCDSDGRIERFIDLHDVARWIPLHDLVPGEDYVVGVFLVGAYQETLGDLHNLFGDTNVVSVVLDEDGEVAYSKEVAGDSVEDVLTYVEYEPKVLVNNFRAFVESALRQKRISVGERNAAMQAYEDGMRGYTYFEE
ncbi:MAG TPA: biosynthetic arginine decarboxylase, partial [Desulfobacterales bacterium]|nr:biosynthetic arginine decarboxylase [Desulfobacterales bacterium]